MAARREAEARAARADAAATGGGEDGGDGPVLRGDRRPKRNVLAKAGVGLAGLMVLAMAAMARAPRPPRLAADCIKPAFAVSSPAKQHRPIAFTIVGPSDRRYALGVDTATFVEQGGAWVPVPQAGKTADDVVVVKDEAMPRCARTGAFSLGLPLGRHTVTLYELVPGRGAIEIQRETLELVEPEDVQQPE